MNRTMTRNFMLLTLAYLDFSEWNLTYNDYKQTDLSINVYRHMNMFGKNIMTLFPIRIFQLIFDWDKKFVVMRLEYSTILLFSGNVFGLVCI
jgi:hypothetical protein